MASSKETTPKKSLFIVRSDSAENTTWRTTESGPSTITIAIEHPLFFSGRSIRENVSPSILFKVAPDLQSRLEGTRVVLPSTVDEDAAHDVVTAILHSATNNQPLDLQDADIIHYIKIHMTVTLFGMKVEAHRLLESLWEVFGHKALTLDDVEWLWEMFGSGANAEHANEYIDMMSWQLSNMQAEGSLARDINEYIGEENKVLGSILVDRYKSHGKDRAPKPTSTKDTHFERKNEVETKGQIVSDHILESPASSKYAGKKKCVTHREPETPQPSFMKSVQVSMTDANRDTPTWLQKSKSPNIPVHEAHGGVAFGAPSTSSVQYGASGAQVADKPGFMHSVQVSMTDRPPSFQPFYGFNLGQISNKARNFDTNMTVAPAPSAKSVPILASVGSAFSQPSTSSQCLASQPATTPFGSKVPNSKPQLQPSHCIHNSQLTPAPQSVFRTPFGASSPNASFISDGGSTVVNTPNSSFDSLFKASSVAMPFNALNAATAPFGQTTSTPTNDTTATPFGQAASVPTNYISTNLFGQVAPTPTNPNINRAPNYNFQAGADVPTNPFAAQNVSQFNAGVSISQRRKLTPRSRNTQARRR